MPPFSFNSTPEMQELLNAIANNSKNKAQVEQAGGTDMVNGAIQQGLAQRDAAFAQQQAAANAQAQQQALAQQQATQQPAPQQQSPLNPVSLGLIESIIGNKAGYMGADAAVRASNPQETNADVLRGYADIIRAGAHKGAQETRELAKALGIDLSDYDENVTLEDAQRNLKTRQSKELKELLDSQSKYGRTSDQYFQDEFDMAIARGKSVREAKKIAGEKTNRYDAERVSYLRNAYNVYGRDGNYTNDVGVEILQNLAQDNPLVAQVYSQAYGMPMKAQERTNQLEDADILFNQGLKRMDVAHGYNKELAELQGSIQRTNATHMGNITRENATHQNKLNMERDLAQAQNSFDNWRKQRKILIDDEQGAATRQANGYYNMVYLMVRQMGGTEEEAADFAGRKTLAYIDNFGVGKGGSKGGNKPTEPKYTEKQQDFLNVVENVFTRAYNDPTDTASIDRMEELINGEVEGQKAGDNFPVAMRQRWDDMINALRGMSYKIKADDDKATEYWSKVKDVNVLEELYPKENWDWYWERRGGKPK